MSADAIKARTPLSGLSAAGSAALELATWDDGSPLILENPDQWWVGSESSDTIVLLREFVPLPADGSFDSVDVTGADHELFMIQNVGDAVNRPAGWYVMANALCALTVDLGELTVPRVQLDPTMLPEADSSELHLLVTEQQCNSGEDAEGRVEIVRLDEDGTSISLVLGVSPRRDVTAVTCQGNPHTPFTVTLAEPIGDRAILDTAFVTPKPVTVPDAFD